MRLDTKLNIYGDGRIRLGKRVTTYERVSFSVVGGKLNIGNRVGFNRNCIITCWDAVDIGDGCSFGPNVVIFDHDHKYGIDGIQNDYNTTPIIIGERCWIGANVTILRGTQIGDGCVIGAGTVLKGVIPPHSIVKSDKNLIIEPIVEID